DRGRHDGGLVARHRPGGRELREAGRLEVGPEREVRDAVIASRQIDDLHRHVLVAIRDPDAVRSVRQLDGRRRDAVRLAIPETGTLGSAETTLIPPYSTASSVACSSRRPDT